MALCSLNITLSRRHQPPCPGQHPRAGVHERCQRVLGGGLRWRLRTDILSLVRPSVSQPCMLCSLLLPCPRPLSPGEVWGARTWLQPTHLQPIFGAGVSLGCPGPRCLSGISSSLPSFLCPWHFLSQSMTYPQSGSHATLPHGCRAGYGVVSATPPPVLLCSLGLFPCPVFLPWSGNVSGTQGYYRQFSVHLVSRLLRGLAVSG